VVVDIGKRVRDAREARGLTQEELARRAGVPLNRVGRVETGAVTDPHYSTLSRIADGLGMSVGELLEAEPVPLAEAPIDTGRAGDEQRKDLGDAFRPRHSVPHSNPAETAEEDLEALYGPWKKLVDDHVDRWTKKLEAGDFDLGEARECWAILRDVTRVLGKLNSLEQQDLPPQPAPYGFPKARTGRAMYRINDLIGPLNEGIRSKYGEDKLSQMHQHPAELEALREAIAG
jgi:transcriptional regulator with XRE-family HTH domain